MIPFNKPFLTGKEAHYMYQAVYAGKLSGNGFLLKNVSLFLKSIMDLRNACLQHPELMLWRCVQCFATYIRVMR